MSYRPYDAIVAQAVAITSAAAKFTIQNDSGSDILAFQPVATDSEGKVKGINISEDMDALKLLGIAVENISNGSYGNVIASGKLENITTVFDFGDYIYVSKTGGLTNILPSEGVGGFASEDWILRIGLIVRNRQIPSQKDLVVNLSIVGRL